MHPECARWCKCKHGETGERWKRQRSYQSTTVRAAICWRVNGQAGAAVHRAARTQPASLGQFTIAGAAADRSGRSERLPAGEGGAQRSEPPGEGGLHLRRLLVVGVRGGFRWPPGCVRPPLLPWLRSYLVSESELLPDVQGPRFELGKDLPRNGQDCLEGKRGAAVIQGLARSRSGCAGGPTLTAAARSTGMQRL